MDLTARELGLIEEALLGQNSTIQKHVEILRNNTSMDSAASALMQLHWEIADLLEKIRAKKERLTNTKVVTNIAGVGVDMTGIIDPDDVHEGAPK